MRCSLPLVLCVFQAVSCRRGFTDGAAEPTQIQPASYMRRNHSFTTATLQHLAWLLVAAVCMTSMEAQARAPFGPQAAAPVDTSAQADAAAGAASEDRIGHVRSAPAEACSTRIDAIREAKKASDWTSVLAHAFPENSCETLAFDRPTWGAQQKIWAQYHLERYEDVLASAREVLSGAEVGTDSSTTSFIAEVAGLAAHWLVLPQETLHYYRIASYYSRPRSAKARINLWVSLATITYKYDTVHGALPHAREAHRIARTSTEVSDPSWLRVYVSLSQAYVGRAILDGRDFDVASAERYNDRATEVATRMDPTPNVLKDRLFLQAQQGVIAGLKGDHERFNRTFAELDDAVPNCECPKMRVIVRELEAWYLQHQGDLRRALEAYRALEPFSREHNPTRVPNTLKGIVQAASELGRFEEARQALTRLEELDTSHQYQEASATYVEAIREGESDGSSWLQVAGLVLLLTGIVQFGMMAYRRTRPSPADVDEGSRAAASGEKTAQEAFADRRPTVQEDANDRGGGGTLDREELDREDLDREDLDHEDLDHEDLDHEDMGREKLGNEKNAAEWTVLDPAELLARLETMADETPVIHRVSGNESVDPASAEAMVELPGLDERQVLGRGAAEPRRPTRTGDVEIQCYGPDGSFSHDMPVPQRVARTLAADRFFGLSLPDVTLVLYRFFEPREHVVRQDSNGAFQVDDSRPIRAIPVAIVQRS